MLIITIAGGRGKSLTRRHEGTEARRKRIFNHGVSRRKKEEEGKVKN
jgi:hypothetical protein